MISLFEFIGGYFAGIVILTPVLLFLGVCTAARKK